MAAAPGDKRKLRATVERAFPAEALPEALVVGEAPDEESCKLAHVLGGRRWTEVPPEDWGALCDALPLFSQAGLRAYLGGFLRAALEDEEVREALVRSLVPPEKLPVRRAFQARAEALNAVQRGAVADVLR